MCEYVWKEARYQLFLSKWGIAIFLVAGYKILSNAEVNHSDIQIADDLYFRLSLLPWPQSQQLTATEEHCFCQGLRLVNKNILKSLQSSACMIALKRIEFSDCYIQDEAFTACAMQWASEMFAFPMPAVKVWFDDTAPPCGKYIFAF